MGTYLVVANQTIGSPELLEGLKTLQLRDPMAEFVLLVPATPSNQIVGPQDERRQSAEAIAREARKALEAEQLTVLEVKAGDGLPFRAIDDEIEAKNRIFNGIVISTLPPGVSHWVSQDLPRRVERRWGLPVRHIIAHGSAD